MNENKKYRQKKETDKYREEILDYLLKKKLNLKLGPKKLARRMGIIDEDYSDFRNAFKRLRAEGRFISGSSKVLTFPNGESTVHGRFISNPKGFGFVVPDNQNDHADVFVPIGKTLGASESDIVVALLEKTDKKDGAVRYAGRIIEIKQRENTGVIGTLEKSEHTWFVIPDGRRFSKPVVIRDILKEQQKEGSKVKVDIIWFPSDNSMPEGVIVDTFGHSGEPAAEIQSVMAAFSLSDSFSDEAMGDAALSAKEFDPDNCQQRADLTDKTIITIDPDDAKDYDDAISLEQLDNGAYRLGVHIADVSYFVKDGSVLDDEAKQRGMSVYFPRHVVPMLPGMLSNGLCSLQEGVKRFAMTAYIDYSKDGEVTGESVARSVIKSARRLTYKGAQSIIDKESTDSNKKVVDLLLVMNELSKKIESRRKKQGMIHLELPEIELELDSSGAVTGASPADNSYTHKMIEMFMVEANEAVARIIYKHEVPFIRRVHPQPESESMLQLSQFVKACGYDLSPLPALADLINLIEQASGTPESYAVNLAVLRSFQRAVYSTDDEGHFALASRHYAHFTSPIRRYPDLVIHRQIQNIIDKKGFGDKGKLKKELDELASHLSAQERIAQNAETELKLVLVLQHLSTKTGEIFDGIITGVADFGLFVQHPVFLIEGLIRLTELGDDWWEVSTEEGKVRGEYSGKVYKIGSVINVRIDGVDIPRRQLGLSPSWTDRKLTTVKSPLKKYNSTLNPDKRRTDTRSPLKTDTSSFEKRKPGKKGRKKPSKKSSGFQLKTGLVKNKKSGSKSRKKATSRSAGKKK